MKPFFQFGIFFIVFWFLIVFSSCHKNDDTFFLNTDNDEIFIPLKTTDTILYALVDNIKIPIYLSIPKICNNESYPAVVVLHGSDGMVKIIHILLLEIKTIIFKKVLCQVKVMNGENYLIRIV